MITLPKGWAVLDIETTTSNNGNPFDQTNKACYIGLYLDGKSHLFKIEYDNEPYGQTLRQLEELLAQTSCLVGFNIKFDLHWLRRYLPDYRPTRVWDCQLFEFIRSNQNNSYPTLNESCEFYKIPGKLSDIADDYWGKGIDTTDVPEDKLRSYLTQDLLCTAELFTKQYDQFSGARRMLFLLHCQDLLVLQEMEWNGLVFNTELSKKSGDEIEAYRVAILKELDELTAPQKFNWNSSDEISVFFFGGHLKREGVEIATRQLKSGAIKKYERKCINIIPIEGKIDPKSEGMAETKPTSQWSEEELATINARRKETGDPPFCRIYSVAEDALRVCHTTNVTAKRAIKLLLKLAEYNKLEGTYYRGIPKLMEEMHWPPHKIHGTINQCRAITGRTSSSKPNVQNFDTRLKVLFPSRYAD